MTAALVLFGLGVLALVFALRRVSLTIWYWPIWNGTFLIYDAIQAGVGLARGDLGSTVFYLLLGLFMLFCLKTSIRVRNYELTRRHSVPDGKEE